MLISVRLFCSTLFVIICSNVAAFQAPIAHTRCASKIHRSTNTHVAVASTSRSLLTERRFAVPNLIGEVKAASTVILPAFAGLSVDQLLLQNTPLNGLGALLTILVASALSALDHHASNPLSSIYQLCWTRFLPASLSLWLVASTVEEENRESSPGKDARDELSATCIPFAIGCLGSALGCALSFACCCIGGKNERHSRLWKGRKHYFLLPGHLLLAPAEAAVAAGCLCSAYIGGPWNYFACMRILGEDGSLPEFAREGVRGVLGSTFGSSASDMLLYPIYFSVLQAFVSSKTMRKLFPGRCRMNDQGVCLPMKEDNSTSRDIYKDFSEKSLARARLLITAVTVPAVWMIVALSDICESRAGVPGMGIAVNSALSCVVPAAFYQLVRSFRSRIDFAKIRTLIIAEVRAITTGLSNVCYYMLLSVIGVTTNLGREIFDGGWAESSSFLFASTSLLVHVVFILLGSMGVMRLFPKFKQFPLSVEEIGVASCAAISGPQAAASLAVKMSVEKRVVEKSNNVAVNWRGLILSGTVLGVLGYIISCPVGVLLSKLLLCLIEKWQIYS